MIYLNKEIQLFNFYNINFIFTIISIFLCGIMTQKYYHSFFLTIYLITKYNCILKLFKTTFGGLPLN